MAKISFDGFSVNEDKLASKVIADFDLALDTTVSRDYDSALEQYRGILPKKIKPWKNCSNLNVPITEIAVDTYWANLMRSFFNTYDVVDVRPVSANDILTADKRKQFLNWQLNNEIKIHPIVDKILEISLVYGDCIVKTRYSLESRTIKNEGGVEGGEEGKREIVEYDAPKIDVPNIDEVFLSPSAVGLQRNDNEFIVHRMVMTRAEYQDRVRTQGYKDIPMGSADGKSDNEDIQDFQKIDDLQRILERRSKFLRDESNTVVLLEWHGTYYVTDRADEQTGEYSEIVVTVHPSSKRIAKVFVNPLPFRPFVKFTPFPVANRPYGRGLPEKLKYLQAEINTIHNQRIDTATMRILNPFVYTEGGTFDPTTFRIEPLGGYPVPNVNDIKFLNPPDASQNQYREEQIITDLFERLVGVSETVQGKISTGDTTATEVATANARGDIRFDLVFKRYEQSFIELMTQVATWNQINMPPEKEYRIVGNDGRFKWNSITKDDMGGKLDLALSAHSTAQERAKIAQAQLIYSAGVTNPIVMSNQRALYEITKFLFEPVGGKDVNIDRILPKPPQAATRTPQEEHDLMYEGRVVAPDIREDAQLHLVTHDAEVMNPEFQQEIAQEIKNLFMRHIEATKALVAAQMQSQKQPGAFQQIGTGAFQPGATAPAPQPGQGGVQKPNLQQGGIT